MAYLRLSFLFAIFAIGGCQALSKPVGGVPVYQDVGNQIGDAILEASGQPGTWYDKAIGITLAAMAAGSGAVVANMRRNNRVREENAKLREDAALKMPCPPTEG